MMSNTSKTREQLIDEIKALKQKLTKSEKLEAKLNGINQQLNTGKQQLQTANQQLKESKATVIKNRALLHAILESPHGMIVFALDKEYRYTAFTSQHKQIMKKIWGVEIKIGMSMLEAIPDPADREKAKKNFDKALHGEHLVLVEEYGDKHLQRLFWENRYAPVYNEQNEIIGLSVFVIDITERKIAEERLNAMNQQLTANEQQLMAANQQLKADEQQLRAANQQLEANEQQLQAANQQLKAIEQQLRAANQQLEANNQQLAASEQQLRALNQELSASKKVTEQEKKFSENLVETANSFIVVLDPNANITLFNRFAEKLTGYKKEEVIGKNWFELFILKEDGNTIPRVFSGIFKEMPGYSSRENPILLKDGTEKIISWKNTILKNENGEISGALSIGIDITERKKTEETLRQSENRFDLAMSVKNEGMWDWNLITNEVYFDPRYYEMAGYEIDEFPHKLKEFQDRVHPDDIDKVMKMARRYIAGELEQYNQEFRFRKKNGNWIWINGRGKIVEWTDNETPSRFIGTHTNITKRKKTEEALRQSEKKYRTILENIEESYFEVDIAGNYTFFNDSLCRLLGYSKDELMGMNNRQYTDVENAKKVFQTFNEVFRTGKPTKVFEWEIIKKDGAKRFIETSISLMRNSADEPAGFHGLVRDITERKKTEDALKENEAKLSTIIEHSPNGIYVIDDNEKVILINEAIIKIIGYPKNEILNQPIKKFIDKENLQMVVERYKKRLSGEKVPSHYEFNVIRKNGEKRIVEISSSAVKEKTGKSIIVAHMEDVTEKRKYEKAQQFLYNISKISLTEISLKNYLGQIHQELKQLMKADNFYVALYDSANGKYSFPYDVDEYDDFDGLENIKLDGTVTDYVRKTAKGQIITKETEREIKKKEKIKIVGQPAPVWLGAPLMNASGEVMGVIAVQDYKNPKAYTKLDLELLEIVANNTGVFIERVKNIENLKKAKEKAEESDRLKSAFLANMSHEIRTPMNGILGFTELLEDSDFSVKEKTEFISNIRKSGDRLLNTVNDIIDISKIETGLVKIALQEINVNEQIKNFCQFFKLEAEAKGVELTYSNSLQEEPVIIKTDENKFGSILTNLIKNAIKFTDEGSIQVGYEIIRKGHTDFMRFFVKDTGIGIPASRQEAIFNRFVQADIGNTRAFQGSGLGLAISKSYVEMLGGELWVESVEGNGSKFYFTLPYHKTETVAAPGKKELSQKKQGTKNDHKKIKILIAEDEKFAIDYLSIVLKKGTNEILYAKNGVEAVELCHSHPDIDVILMDVKMPVMDGYEATRKIRKFNKEVIIIAQTANALSGDKKEALETGCNDYISKPIKKEALLAMINHHLKKKKRT